MTRRYDTFWKPDISTIVCKSIPQSKEIMKIQLAVATAADLLSTEACRSTRSKCITNGLLRLCRHGHSGALLAQRQQLGSCAYTRGALSLLTSLPSWISRIITPSWELNSGPQFAVSSSVSVGTFRVQHAVLRIHGKYDDGVWKNDASSNSLRN